jgi:hypothetical protein
VVSLAGLCVAGRLMGSLAGYGMLDGEDAEAACSTTRSRGAALTQSGWDLGSRDVASGAARGAFIGRQPVTLMA